MKAFQRTFQRLEPQAVLAGFRKFSRVCSNVWSGSAHRLSRACQRLFQQLEQQRSQAFSGFTETVPTVRTAASQAFTCCQRLFAGNGWNGNVPQRLEPHRSQAFAAVETVGKARTAASQAFTGFQRLSNGWNGSADRLSPAFQKPLSPVPETVPMVGTAA